MYNYNKAQQSKNRVHISWDILYVPLPGPVLDCGVRGRFENMCELLNLRAFKI